MTFTAQQLTDLINENGGFTLSFHTGLPVSTGFAVACDKTTWGIRGVEALDQDMIETFLRLNAERINRGGVALGGWKNESGFWIELTQVFRNERNAKVVGRKRGELAIFDLGKLQEITL